MTGASFAPTHHPATADGAAAPITEHAAAAAAPSAWGAALPGLAVRDAGDPLGGAEVDPEAQRALVAPGRGRPMATEVRRSMEGALQTDLSGVRVHTDSTADRLARSFQATAFTHGSNIYFAQGRYDPASERGQHLLAHELTHVVQQQQGRDPGTAGGALTVGRADDPLEAEAERTAGDVVATLRRHTSGCGCGQEHR